MTLEEEKEMVAEKLMGWSLDDDCLYHHRKKSNHCHLSDFHTRENRMHWSKWSPQDNELATFKEWDEIWEKMPVETRLLYVGNIMKIMGHELKAITWDTVDLWMCATASPEIRWKALITVLLEDK